MGDKFQAVDQNDSSQIYIPYDKFTNGLSANRRFQYGKWSYGWKKDEVEESQDQSRKSQNNSPIVEEQDDDAEFYANFAELQGLLDLGSDSDDDVEESVPGNQQDKLDSYHENPESELVQ